MSFGIRRRYFAHLLEYCERVSREASRQYVMLSGGIDSFVLLCAAVRLFGAQNVTALVIRGVFSDDYAKAIQAARHFGVGVSEIRICMNDVLDGAHLSRGTSDKSVFQMIFRVGAHRLFQSVNIAGGAVYQGDGADSLYGNSSSFVYRTAASVADSQGITIAAARERLRRQWRGRVMRGHGTGTASLVRSLIESRGAIPVQPWVSGEFEYVLDVPLTMFRGDKKEWVRDGLVSEWGIGPSIVATRSRCSMQNGLGYYPLLCEELKAKYGCKTANAAVLAIARGAA